MQSKHKQSNQQNTEQNRTQQEMAHIDEEIYQLQQQQASSLTQMNNNGNNMYVKNNPSLNGYKSNNGNHYQRTKMLSKPNSFVPGFLANEINEIGQNPINWQSEQRRTDHDFNDGNKHFFIEHDGYHVTYQLQNGQGNYEINYHNHDNNNDNGGGQFNDNYDRYPDGYGRHQRHNNYSHQSRFKPYYDHNNIINYGLNDDAQY